MRHLVGVFQLQLKTIRNGGTNSNETENREPCVPNHNFSQAILGSYPVTVAKMPQTTTLLQSSFFWEVIL